MRKRVESDSTILFVNYFLGSCFFLMCFSSLFTLHFNFSITEQASVNLFLEELSNLVPFISTGILALIFLIFLNNYFKLVCIEYEGIIVLGWNKNKLLPWDKIKKIKKIVSRSKGGVYHTYFMVTTIEGKTFFTVSDEYSSKDYFKSTMGSQMEREISRHLKIWQK